MAMHARQRRMVLIPAFLLAWGMSATHAAESGGTTVPAMATATRNAAPSPWCLERCAPDKLIKAKRLAASIVDWDGEAVW